MLHQCVDPILIAQMQVAATLVRVAQDMRGILMTLPQDAQVEHKVSHNCHQIPFLPQCLESFHMIMVLLLEHKS